MIKLAPLIEAPVNTDEYAMFYNALSTEKQSKFDSFINTMPTNLLAEFKKMIKSLTSAEIKKFAEFFKSLKTVADLDGVDYRPYRKIWDTYVGQAIGKGELFISFAVDSAVVQGSSESFDIDDAGRRYEVKSLDVLDSKSGNYKYGNIRPGTEGKVSKYLFTKQLMQFYTLINGLQLPEIRNSVMSLGAESAMQKIYDIIDKISVKKPKGGNVLTSPGDIPLSMLSQVYDNAIALHKIKTLPLMNKDVTTSRISVKGAGADNSYWISPKDAEEIAKSSGKESQINIKVGAAITDETKEGKIILADLFNHPFVANPTSFTDGLYEIKMSFFGDKSGLVYFFQGITQVSDDMSEFATIESSQDGYRFGLKSRYKSLTYVQDQK